MGDTTSGARSPRTRQVRRRVAVETVPDWREAFHAGWDYQRSGDVNHVSRTVTQRLQNQWDRYAADYQTGVTSQDINNIMKDYDPRTGNLYGYVRTTNSFAINEALYAPQNANRTDAEIFTRRDRRGRLRDLETVRTLDRLISSHKTKGNATYTRFSTPNAIQALYGLSDQQMNMLNSARTMTPAQLQTLNRAFAGKTGYSRAYTSTSANRSMNAFGNLRARHSAGMIYERKLYMPDGTPAYAVQRNAQESEVMFGRHANTRLMKVTVSDDGHIVMHEMFTGYRRR